MGVLAFLEPSGLAPPVGYSHAVMSDGPLVHVAGQIPLDADGNVVGVSDFGAQVEQAFANVEAALAAAGATFASIASLTIYCAASVETAQLAAIRQPLLARIGTGKAPAITLVFVHRLLDCHWLVEVPAIAATNQNSFNAVTRKRGT